MRTAQKTKTKPDTRDQIGGYPLPWKVVDQDRMGGDLVDDDGEVITNFGDDEFYVDLAAGVNHASARIAALEAALIEVAQLFKEAGDNDVARETAGIMIRETLTNLGLADRLPGNPSEAEEAVAS